MSLTVDPAGIRPPSAGPPAPGWAAVEADLRARPRTWLVTGAAGFIGSSLVERLLTLEQRVVGLDNFATGSPANLDDALARAEGGGAFRFIEGDIRDAAACGEASRDVEVVLHQAALGSVPRSMEDPAATDAVNVGGTVNVLAAARAAGVRRVVYASSSSVYGDHPALPKREDEVGRPLSPYAVSKRAGELYAQAFQLGFGLEAVGLRYFNVFGRRQDPAGPYAAVIPRWAAALVAGQPGTIYGDGETSRDFCYVANVVQANLLAALAPPEATGTVYNVAAGARTTLSELYGALRRLLAPQVPGGVTPPAVYAPARAGDIRHSLADVSRAARALGYAPTHDVEAGLREALPWYVARARRAAAVAAG